MTKGKYAARSELRRESAAAQHVSRLIDELTDAKLRARMHEAAARELPVVKAELARLKALAEEGSSDTLEREAKRWTALLQEADDRFAGLVALLALHLERTRGTDDGGFTYKEWGELRDLIGPLGEAFPSFATSRAQRKNTAMSPRKLEAFFALLDRASGRDGDLRGKVAARLGVAAPDDDSRDSR